MTCPNCGDGCRVPFGGANGPRKYVACWLCERGQRTMGIGRHFYGADLRQGGEVGAQLLVWPGTLPGHYLHGGVGRGKTYLASAVCRHQASQGRTARFLSSARLLELIKATFDSNPTEDRENASYALRHYADADVVVLDDLGAEHNTEWAEAELMKWIDGFYERETALVVTSNLTERELMERLGRRIGSRVIGMTEALELTGPDRRIQQAPRPKLAVVRHVPPPEPTEEEHAACRERNREVIRRAAEAIHLGKPLEPARGLVPGRTAAAPVGLRLTPERRQQLAEMIRNGEAIPASWQQFVDEVRSDTEATG